MEKTLELEKIELADGNSVVKLTPELLQLFFYNQDVLFGQYDICLVHKDDSRSGNYAKHLLVVGKGIALKPETLKKLEGLLFNNKFKGMVDED